MRPQAPESVACYTLNGKRYCTRPLWILRSANHRESLTLAPVRHARKSSSPDVLDVKKELSVPTTLPPVYLGTWAMDAVGAVG